MVVETSKGQKKKKKKLYLVLNILKTEKIKILHHECVIISMELNIIRQCFVIQAQNTFDQLDKKTKPNKFEKIPLKTLYR